MTLARAPSPRPLPARRPAEVPAPNATLIAVTEHGPLVRTLRLEMDDAAATWAAGQYVSIGLDIGDRLLQRPYSLASLPGDVGVELAVRLVPDGALTPRLWPLRPGARLRIGTPKGRFRLRPNDDRPHLLLGSGTGIAPLVAMTAELVARPSAPRVAIVHGVRLVDELAFHGRLRGWAAARRVTYAPAISRPNDPGNTGWSGLVGRVDRVLPSILESTGIEPAALVAYVCGSPLAIDAIQARLYDLGVPAEGVVTESF